MKQKQYKVSQNRLQDNMICDAFKCHLFYLAEGWHPDVQAHSSLSDRDKSKN